MINLYIGGSDDPKNFPSTLYSKVIYKVCSFVMEGVLISKFLVNSKTLMNLLRSTKTVVQLELCEFTIKDETKLNFESEISGIELYGCTPYESIPLISEGIKSSPFAVTLKEFTFTLSRNDEEEKFDESDFPLEIGNKEFGTVNEEDSIHHYYCDDDIE